MQSWQTYYKYAANGQKTPAKAWMISTGRENNSTRCRSLRHLAAPRLEGMTFSPLTACLPQQVERKISGVNTTYIQFETLQCFANRKYLFVSCKTVLFFGYITSTRVEDFRSLPSGDFMLSCSAVLYISSVMRSSRIVLIMATMCRQPSRIC